MRHIVIALIAAAIVAGLTWQAAWPSFDPTEESTRQVAFPCGPQEPGQPVCDTMWHEVTTTRGYRPLEIVSLSFGLLAFALTIPVSVYLGHRRKLARREADRMPAARVATTR